MKRTIGKGSSVGLLFTLLLWAAAAVAQGIHLNVFSEFNGNAPIGIDYHEPNGGNLVLTANYPTGQPYNINLIRIATGQVTQYSNLAGLTDELKIASTRSSAGCQQYPAGTVFLGNGVPGEIVRIDPAGNVFPPAPNNPGSVGNRSWVKLPGEPFLLRGSLYVDRSCSFGGDLIVVTGNGEDPQGGGVWRVSSDGSASRVANIPGTHLEGMITLPVNPKYGPWSGSIIAGAEHLNQHLNRDGTIYSITPAGVVTAWNLSFTDQFGVHHPVKPEDIDIIKSGADFFGVAYQDQKVMRAPASDFAQYADQILITQEFPCGSISADVLTPCTGPYRVTTGLYVVNWNGQSFSVTPLQFAPDSPIQMIRQWEHVTFAPRGDVTLTKTTDTPNVQVGGTARFTITITSNGPEDAFNVIMSDPLPSAGGSVWNLSGPDSASCFISNGTLMCTYQSLPAGQSRSITLSTTTTSANCPSITNTARVTSGNDSNSENNTAGPVTVNVACQAQLRVEKLPKTGTFTAGGQASFSIKVSNTGTVPATNVTLSDQLPGNGGLVWQSASTTQGTCANPIAGNLLNCNLGTIQPNSSVTVTLVSTPTTPFAACQPQPNPAAIARADGNVSAQDSGGLTCNGTPGISIVKLTNGTRVTDPNAPGVPNVAPGSTVTWTYRVTNTGSVAIPAGSVQVTDNTPGVSPQPVLSFGFVSGDVNQNNVLDPGEVWIYQASGAAINLVLPPPTGVRTVQSACTAGGFQLPRTAYTNVGTVSIPGATASDTSYYCNPPSPNVTIVKLTNGLRVTDPNQAGVPNISAGSLVTWTYRVTNTGNVSIPSSQVQVTDSTTGVRPVFNSEQSGNRDGNFDPGEVWIYSATGTAINLLLPPPNGVQVVQNTCTAGGSQPPRTAYTNTGSVTVLGVTASDISYYCNPPSPNIQIVKLTNGVRSNDPNAAGVPNIAAGQPVTWTYRVTNTGNVSISAGSVVVTDNTTGVNPQPVVSGGFVSGDVNQNNTLDPGEVWIYQATGTAVNLMLPPPSVHTVPGVCTGNGQQPPRTAYMNIGTVTVPGATASDTSTYCNPPAPGLSIIKLTNGADANDPNAAGVPNIAPGQPVTWTYRVTNTGNISIPRSSLTVTDNTPGITLTFNAEFNGNGDNNLDPGETWQYMATGTALDLALPAPNGVRTVTGSCTAGGFQPPRTAYINIGTATAMGITVSDPSSYCNPPNPAVTIVKLTNGIRVTNANQLGVPNISAGSLVTWTYRVTNTGNVPIPRGSVQVTDNTFGLNPQPVTSGGFVSGDVNNNNVFDPGEVWTYQATGTAINLLLPPPNGVHVVQNGCTAGGSQPPRTAYTNVGTVTIQGAAASDTSYYCNPPSPDIQIVKLTNGVRSNDPNGSNVPNIAPNGLVTWTYRVTNTGQTSVPASQVVVTDNTLGVNPTFAGEELGNNNGTFDPGEVWIYTATGRALNLTLPAPNGTTTQPNVCTANGNQPPRTAYTNIGRVSIPGATASDTSSYCNPPQPGISIVKYTNSQDANDPNGTDVPLIGAGSTVTWTYWVKNTGQTSIPRGSIQVTDDSGVNPVFNRVVSGNGDNNLDPGETWEYMAGGIALNLTQPVPQGVHTVAMSCTANGTRPPSTAYRNVGTVTVPGASASDPSHYCNPPSPGVQIVKYTNGANADDPNGASVPFVPIGSTVTWTYQVTNTGNSAVPFAQLHVTDNTNGVNPQPIMSGGFVSGDVNRNNVFDPGEVWMYQATGTALNLSQPVPSGTQTVPNACTKGNTQPPATAYINFGTATIPGASDTDASVYCNERPVCQLSSGNVNFSGNQVTFAVNNTGSGGATLRNLSFSWPSANGVLKAILLNGVVIDNVGDMTGTSVTLSEAQLTANTSARTIGANGSAVITLQFSKTASSDAGMYSGNFNFGDNCSVSFNSNVCFLGYPYSSSNPLTSTIFNESEVLRWVDPAVATGTSATVQLYYSDEHAMLLGVRNGGFSVSPLPSNPGHVSNPQIGDPSVTDPFGRPIFPAVFVTDITGVSDNASHTSAAYRAGDWQYGGRPNKPDDVFGTWKGGTVSGGVFTIDPDPAKNNWNLGPGSDTPSVGFAALTNQGYGTEVRWNVSSLVDANGNKLIPGHTYRLQFMVHDGDQNKTGGDVGQACTILQYR